jgi:3-phenylpropionate/cinnamic acid dioxygenase small subunit
MSQTDLAAWVDKLAIRDLLERYMRYNDDGDLDRILELFEPDAAYQVMGHVLIGRQQIGEFLQARGFSHDRPAWTEPGQLLNQTRSAHISSNPIIDIDGDRATVESDFQVARRDSDGRARIVLLGRYRDEVRRGSDGKWRLYTRTGVSVGRPGEEHTDSEWQQALAGAPDEQRAKLRA